MDLGQLTDGRTRETTIRRDAQGRWFHDGEPVEHEKLTRAFDRWVSRAEDGRLCLKNDINWAYVSIEGAPLFVRSVELGPGSALLTLSNDAVVPLDPRTLREDAQGALYCDTPFELTARFSRHAADQLAPLLHEDAEGTYLELGGVRVRPPVVADPLR